MALLKKKKPVIIVVVFLVPAPKNVEALVTPATVPTLPNTDTIPRNRKNTLQLPISNLPPKKPVQTPLQLTPIAEKRNAKNSPCLSTKSPVANELESIMKKKQAGLSIMGNVNQAQKPSLPSKKNVLPSPKPVPSLPLPSKQPKPALTPSTRLPPKPAVKGKPLPTLPASDSQEVPSLPLQSKQPALAPSTRLPPKPAVKGKPLPPLPASESQEEIYNPKWDDEEFETYDDVSKLNLYNL